MVSLLAGSSGAAATGRAVSLHEVAASRAVAQSLAVPREWYGRVLAQNDLEPIAGARLTIEPLPEGGLFADIGSPSPDAAVMAITAEDGRFNFEAPPGGRMRLSAPGFLDGFVLLHAGRDGDLGRLVLRHELSANGRVLLDGRPAAGVVVVAPAYRRTSVMGAPTPETISDAEGRFHLAGVRPEQFRELVFIARGVAESEEMAGLGEPFEPRHYELGDIELLPRLELRGTVVDSGGAPVPDATVSIAYSDTIRLPRDPEYEGTRLGDRFRHGGATSNERGEISLVVVPGEHSLEVFHSSAGHVSTSIRVEGADPADLNVELTSAGWVRGRVVDQQGEPLAGVSVGLPGFRQRRQSIATWTDLYRATTDDDGCFTIRRLGQERGYYEFHRSGFASRAVELEDLADRIAASPGDRCNDAAPIVLTPGAELRGRVADQFGTAVAGANLRLHRHQRPGGGFALAQPSSVASGEDGSYFFEGLAFGDYSMSGDAPGHAYATIDNLPVGPLPSDPGADRIHEALAESPLSRAPDAELYSLDVTLHRLVPVVSHEVVVFDARGVPEPEARVDPWLRDGDPDLRIPEVEDVFTGADGRAVIPELLPGTYTMTARAPESHDYGSVREDHVVRAAGAPTVLTMPEHPPLGEIYGRYVDAQGRGISGAVVHASGTYRRRRRARTTTGTDGSFRFAQLPYARYLLKAEHEELPPVIHSEPMQLDEPSFGPVEIVVPTLGTIEGIVAGLRADELDGVSVSLSAEVEIDGGARQSISAQVRAAEDGTFRVPGLAPGTWSVFAGDRNGRIAGTTVELAPGELLSGIELARPFGFTLTGTITWRGEAPERAWIRGAGNIRGMELEDPTTFEIRDVQPGEHRLWISGTGLRSPYFAYTRVEGDSHIDIVIEGGAINGRVVDARTGAPVGGARVVTNPVPHLVWDAHDESRRADRNGVFRAGPFAAGIWRLEATAPGYAPRAPEVDIGAVDIDDYIIEMQPTRDLEVRLLGPPGLDVSRLYGTWYDETTDEVISTQHLRVVEREAVVRWPDGPIGRGILSITAARMELAARVEVEIGAGPVEVTLEATGNIYVGVPEFADHRPVFAVVRVYDEQGRPVPDAFATSHRMFRQRQRPQHLVNKLVPGRYRVEVETSDGRFFSGEAEVRPYEDSELILR